jgi:hypothetical protein
MGHGENVPFLLQIVPFSLEKLPTDHVHSFWRVVRVKNMGSGLDSKDDPDWQKRLELGQSGNSVKTLELSDPPQETHYPKTNWTD